LEQTNTRAREIRNEILMSEIANAISEAVWIADIKEGNNINYSESIKKITGYSAGEISAMPIKHKSLIVEEDINKVKNKLNAFELSESENSIGLEYRILKKDNTVAWVKEEISKGENSSVVGVLSDITPLRNAQEQLNACEKKIKEINASKDSFITILSHDLRAPFTSILGFAEILLNEPNLPLQDKTEYLTYIYEASQNQLQLINYLLDWSRLQTGKIAVEPERFKAQLIVFNCVSSLTGNAIRKNIEIIANVSDDIYINADERLITQALTNLLNNALKFSPENSKIEITVGNFNNSQVEFVVRDSGVGIREEDQAKLFKVENMFSTEGTSGEKGSGLGLPLVKEIVEKHGGEIWFYSQPGNGSEFHFTVPKPQNTILVVDSQEKERDYISEVIRKTFSDFKIYTAENGFEAMSTILEKNPSLVITEHDLPLMNGLQLIESVKKGNKLIKTPFIILTGANDENVEQMYYKYGISALLKRPLDDRELIKYLNEFVR